MFFEYVKIRIYFLSIILRMFFRNRLIIYWFFRKINFKVFAGLKNSSTFNL